MGFREKLAGAIARNNSLLCIGLDPYPELLPILDVVEFNRAIIQATQDLVCAYKPNLAFYEALGVEGWKALEQTLGFIPRDIPVIGDAKRGDIGPSSQAYARALFEVLGFDATTVNPYLGHDSVEPFLRYQDRGVFLLCRTSNPGAQDFQDELFEKVARKAREWNRHGNVGLVVGATYPQGLKRVRHLCPDMLLLIPGVGVQGGELKSAIKFGRDSGGEGVILAVSRGVLYASPGRDFALKAREQALRLREEINSYRFGP